VMTYLRCGAAIAILSLAGPAFADASRASEDSMFGGGSEASDSAAKPEAKTAPTPQAGQDGDAKELSNANTSRDIFATGENTDNPLQIGGVYYQQFIATESGRNIENQTPLTMPLDLDAFFDARPNDRIRAYIDARMIYDPTRDASGNATSGPNTSGFAAVASAGSSSPTASSASNPEVVLDQAWLKFDLDRALFFTVGKQHVKWGASKIWNPTDALTPTKLDPLQPYDLRLGANMVKADMPLQSVKGNLSALALLDNPMPASTLEQVGGAFRAEGVIGDAEVGIDAVTRADKYPVYGVDLSAPLGPIDVYAEAAMLSGAGYSVPYLKAYPNAGSDLSSIYGQTGIAGPVVQASGGLNYSFAYMPNRQSTLGAEYFYNEIGAESATIYPVMVYLGQYQPFYMGKHYAAIYASAEGPDSSKKTNYNFSTISNISDGSYVSRLDFTWLLLDYLTFGAYGQLNYGTTGGEFNFALNTPTLTYQGHTIPAINTPVSPCAFGLSLRLAY
jgi:hypothetical protein